MRREGRAYATGDAQGRALVLSEPLSFWGGVNGIDGAVIDRSHPQCGANVAGRILVMPGGRGSSSSSSVLAETSRRGVGPVAIILARPDPILAVGCLVVQELYGLSCPLLVCPIEGITTGEQIRVLAAADGSGHLERGAAVRGPLSRPS